MTRPPNGRTNGRSDGFVLFGATGDLAKKKLFPALYQLVREERLDNMPVIGVASRPWSTDDLRDHVASAIRAAESAVDPAVLDDLLGRICYVSGNYQDPATFEGLAEACAMRDVDRPLFYLAIPPSLFDDVVLGVARVNLHQGGRVVVEKPLGRDVPSSRALNGTLLDVFSEESIFRIDHFLGKESVESLLLFRFANSLLEPLWNRTYISRVELTLAESIGVEGRGKFYEEVGALRDVVQNHALEIVMFLAMEPPISADATALRDEKVKVLKTTAPVDVAAVVRGQYEGYRAEDGVAPDSDVETYVALRLDIDSWRWAGVPFYIRAGKRLAAKATEALVEFRPVPRTLFADAAHSPHPNHLRFRFGGDDGVSLSLETKLPGDALVSQTVDLGVSYGAALGERPGEYERLLDDAFDGDATRFAREDAVDRAWQILDPVIAAPPRVVPYTPGSWGPAAGDALITETGGWHLPHGV